MNSLTDYWVNFLTVKPTEYRTINHIETPQFGDIPFSLLLYLFLIILFLALVLVFRHRNKTPLAKQLIIAGCVMGILFAARMDYASLASLEYDRSLLSETSLPDKMLRLRGSLSPAVVAPDISAIIPPGNKIRLLVNKDVDAEWNYTTEMKYYLLPIEVSDHADYLFVYDDNVIFDPRENFLKKEGTVVARGAVLLAQIVNPVTDHVEIRVFSAME